MAVINLVGAIVTTLFDSLDVITGTGDFQVNSGVTLRKTDSLGMTFFMSASVTATQNVTGIIDIRGQRSSIGTTDGFVVIDTNAANPQKGLWDFFTLKGDDVCKFVWIWLRNCTFGIAYQGSVAAPGDYQYVISDNFTENGLFKSSGVGTQNWLDVAIINCDEGPNTHTSEVHNITRIFIRGGGTNGIWEDTRPNTLVTDAHVDTFLGDRFSGADYVNYFRFCQVNDSKNTATDVTTLPYSITNFVLRGGGIPFRKSNAGTVNLTDGDVLKGGQVGLAGVFIINGSAVVTIDNLYIAGTRGYDPGVNHDTTGDQTSGVAFEIDNRDTRNFPIVSSGLSESSLLSTVTFLLTTGTLAKVRIIVYKVSGDLSTKIAESGWDAPDLDLGNGDFIPSGVTDWVEAGKKYALSHSIDMDLPAGTFFWVAEGETLAQEILIPSAQQGPFVVGGGADTVPPVWDTTVGIQSFINNGDGSLKAKWGVATDVDSPPVSYNIYLRKGSAPDVFGSDSPFYKENISELEVNLFTDVDNITLLDLTQEYFCIVRAEDDSGVEDLNTVSLSVPGTPVGNNYENIANIIRTRFEAFIEVAQSVPVQYDNVKIKSTKKDSQGRWIRFSILWAEAFQRDLGRTPGTRIPGIAVAQIFGPLNKGDGILLEVVDEVVAAFKHLSVQGVTFRTPTAGKVGREKDAWRINVNCPFFADNRT